MTKNADPDEITVITLGSLSSNKGQSGQSTTRGGRGSGSTEGSLAEGKIKSSELTAQINAFLTQMEAALKETKSLIGDFQFSEFEVSAGMTATGKLALFTVVGAEASVSGGLKFVFRRVESKA